jgi:tetratricopeptide (TPR) repeat protein
MSQKAELFTYLADMMFLTGRRESALDFGKQALSYARLTHAIIPLVKSGVMIVMILLEHKEASAAADILNSLELEITENQGKLGPQIATARAWLGLHKARQLFIGGDGSAASTLLKDVIDLLELTAGVDPNVLADCYSMRSILHWLQGESILAINDLNQAIKLVSLAGYEYAESALRGNLGLCYRTVGELGKAEETLLRCIRLAERSRLYYRLAFDVGSLALVFLSQGRIQDALVMSERHKTLAKDHSSPAENMRALDIYGMIKFHAGDSQSAQMILEQNVPAYENQSGKTDIIIQLAYISRCYIALGKTDQAIHAAEKAFDYAEQQSYLPPKIMGMRSLAETGMPEQSKSLLNQALTLARQCHRLLDEAACLLSLAAVEQDENDKKKLWEDGSQILQKLGADAWLEGHSPKRPPQMPFVL